MEINTFIIDGNNMAHRARHSYSLSYRGVDTSVTFGVMSMLRALIKTHRPHSLVMCWDGGTPLYRKELVPSYKDNRDRSDDGTYHEFVSQLKELQEILPYFGIMSLYRRGIEADDLMYHASRMLEADDIVIVTTDGDLLQAVNEQVSVLKPKKNGEELVTVENFMQMVSGVRVEQYLSWRVCQGDSSDNIPGIPGVGPKTAWKIVCGDRLSDKIQSNLNTFISSGVYDDSKMCMDLQYDRCGARDVILNSDYVRYNGLKTKSWCIERGFVSLYSNEPLGKTFGKLKKPLIEPPSNMRFPVIWSYARGVQDGKY